MYKMFSLERGEKRMRKWKRKSEARNCGGESDTSEDKRNSTGGFTPLETESARLDGVHINLPVDLR